MQSIRRMYIHVDIYMCVFYESKHMHYNQRSMRGLIVGEDASREASRKSHLNGWPVALPTDCLHSIHRFHISVEAQLQKASSFHEGGLCSLELVPSGGSQLRNELGTTFG
jgi:hypothetical protein